LSLVVSARRVCSLAKILSNAESPSNGKEVSGKFVVGKVVKARLLHEHGLRHDARNDAQIDGRILLAHAAAKVQSAT